jgi:hypothetical protein
LSKIVYACSNFTLQSVRVFQEMAQLMAPSQLARLQAVCDIKENGFLPWYKLSNSGLSWPGAAA